MSPSLPVILAAGEPSYTPSNFMPSVLVEIAFNAGYVTPAASRVWTDVTAYVELHQNIDIDVGRQDERSTADANTLTLTLDNTDGRFTALRAASPYYPNVKIGRPIRVSATTVDGVASIRFVGFIDEWPLEWDGSDAYAKATIRASSRMSRLGLTAKLRSVVEQEVLADGPTRYYTMGDPSGSVTAADSSGNLGAPLSITGSGAGTITFGSATGPGTDGLTACAFTVSGAERYLIAQMPPGTSSTTFGVGCFFSIAATGNAHLIIGYPTANTGSELSLILMETTGQITGGIVAGATVSVTSASAYNDGGTHHAFLTLNAGTLTLYIDGVSVGSAAGVGVRTLPELRVGQQVAGTLAHVEVYGAASPTLPSAARIAAHAASGRSGFAGETTDVRLLRILDWAGVSSSEVTTETGAETMTYQQTGGMSVVDVLRECESTEGGVLFDGADGNVKFHNRSRRYLKTSSATLNMASQHVGSDYAPRLDRSTLVNDITVENPTTGQTARAVDTASSNEYGLATGSAMSVANSYDPLRQKASWTIASYAQPRMRVPSLTVDVLAHQGLTPSAQALLGVTVGDLLAVSNAPTQADTTSPSYFVEGYSERIGPESYSITYNLSPTYPTLNTLVLDSATRGLLDTGILAY